MCDVEIRSSGVTRGEDQDLGEEWSEPTPHSLTPKRIYLGRPGPHTKVAIIALHGRGEGADDFARVFLPSISSRFGGDGRGLLKVDGQDEDYILHDDLEQAGSSSDCHPRDQVCLISLEARDAVWWPDHHRATHEASWIFNGPYIHSSLQRLEKEIRRLEELGVGRSRIVLLGFSQGAILSNTYLLCALSQLEKISAASTSSSDDPPPTPQTTTMPIPANILALAGTIFDADIFYPEKRVPIHNPRGGGGGGEDLASQVIQPPAEQLHQQEQEALVKLHLHCGLSDRYFTEEEVVDAASIISRAATRAGYGEKVRVSVQMEVGGHSILGGMLSKLSQVIQSLIEA
ncbi:hypothetical protein IE53DRAFT_106576 [Violaceomyces palustris]|uniref:Uncharacterized protein n=1 Tax=Violaceomyces palustris TaxID=1673888 RepID=A0ACD0NWQ0_9BASI|nr:hypothetical protein IE53DRAFT_106576 [Violaceomyces palustris]